MSPQTVRYEPAPHVTCTALDDSEAVLLNLETKYFYTLNETGLFVWNRLQTGEAPEQIAASLEANYKIDKQEALDRINRFIETLRRENLIHEAGY